jgi:sortase A
MPLYQYIKAPPATMKPPRRRSRRISFIFMGLGTGILIWVIWPILSFTVFGEDVFSHIVTPINAETLIASTNKDTSNANAWYPTAPQKHISSQVNTYTISIPKLKINNALVTIAGDDLMNSLVHYGGTGLPGQFGTSVIFGHSMLPQFYSAKSYKSIFSTLPTLKEGDEIDVTYDDVQYHYKITEMVVLEANDLSVLEQKFDGSYLTLVTCVPPGTLWKRLNVKAKLQTV